MEIILTLKHFIRFCFGGKNKAVEYRKLDWKLPPHQTLARKGRLWVKATSLRICWHLTRCKMSAWKMACSTQIWTREDNVGMQLEFLPEKAFFWLQPGNLSSCSCEPCSLGRSTESLMEEKADLGARKQDCTILRHELGLIQALPALL